MPSNPNIISPPAGTSGFSTPPPFPTLETGTAGQRKDYQGQYLSLLQEWGIQVTPNIQTLITESARLGHSITTFVYWLRQTPEYHTAFAGIFDGQGNLTMTESQYLGYSQQFGAIAAQAGLDLGPGKLSYLFRNEVSPDEYAVRANAERQLRDNPALFKQFGAEVQRQGLSETVPTKAELFKFVAGLGNSEWYKLWQAAAARTAASEAGISIAKNSGVYAALSRADVLGVARKGFTQDQLAAGFQDVAASLLKDIPLSRIQNYGLTKQDVLQAVFGGPKSAEVRQKIERIRAQEDAFQREQRAAPQVFSDQEGGTGVLGMGYQSGRA